MPALRSSSLRCRAASRKAGGVDGAPHRGQSGATLGSTASPLLPRSGQTCRVWGAARGIRRWPVDVKTRVISQAPHAEKFGKQRELDGCASRPTHTVCPHFLRLILNSLTRIHPKSEGPLSPRKLDPEQRACVEKALGMDDLLLLSGPVGIGKTAVIAEI